jgi:CRP-like cAMP-binding protein
MMLLNKDRRLDVVRYSPTMRQNVVNAILNRLTPDDLASIRPRLRRITFRERTVLQEQGRAIENVIFLETGGVSLQRIAAGRSIEIALMDSRGAVGTPVLLGSRVSSYQSVAISSGSALGIRAEELLKAARERPQLREHLLRDVEGLLLYGAQVAFCGMYHQLEERLAGWLCQASDAMAGSTIPITHAYLSTILGLRRAGVTEALASFEKEGLISRARGTLRVRNRELLVRRGCGCYSTISGSTGFDL